MNSPLKQIFEDIDFLISGFAYDEIELHEGEDCERIKKFKEIMNRYNTL